MVEGRGEGTKKKQQSRLDAELVGGGGGVGGGGSSILHAPRRFWILLEQFGLQPLGHHKFRTENCFSNSRAKLCKLGLYSVYTLQHSECTSPNTVKVTL